MWLPVMVTAHSAVEEVVAQTPEKSKFCLMIDNLEKAMYEKHEMETVFFDGLDVFTIGFASDADPDTGEGGSQHSYGGDSPSDM